MKRIALAIVAALAMASGPALAAPSGSTEISVSGSGSVALPPDVATVAATVETNAANAGDAVAKNNAIYNRVVAAVEKTGVARADIALSSYNVNYNPKPAIVPAPPDANQRYGYTVSRDFTVKVRDIAKAGSVADACTHSGATSIGGVSFGLADSRAARSQATVQAVNDARANAETLAAAAHLRIVSIESMDLDGAGRIAPQPMMRMAANAPTQFDQSNVNVTVSVSITFLAAP
jgi:uncharacterized protein YggE